MPTSGKPSGEKPSRWERAKAKATEIKDTVANKLSEATHREYTEVGGSGNGTNGTTSTPPTDLFAPDKNTQATSVEPHKFKSYGTFP